MSKYNGKKKKKHKKLPEALKKKINDEKRKITYG